MRSRNPAGLVFALVLAGGCAVAGADVPWAQTLPESGEAHRIDPTAPEPNSQAEADALLDRLFARLHRAEDEATAKVVEQAIWNLWARSGSPTADAMLTQANRAAADDAYGAALRILDTLVAFKPDFVEGWNRRATVHFLERDFDSSLEDIERVLELEPRHFGALTGLGMIRRQLGNKRGALRAFRRALSIHPHLPAAKKAVEALRPELEQDI